jgi:hypothetical protein
MLNGLALILFVFPIFNFTLWRDTTPERAIKNLWELIAILLAAALLVVVIVLPVDFLLYPLAILSSLGVVTMLTIINSMIAAVVLRREGYAQTWWQALPTLAVGAALAILEMTGMILLRAYLTAKLGLPF